MYADANADGHCLSLGVGCHETPLLHTSLLDLRPGQHGLPDMILAHDGEIEDGQDGVPDKLVDGSAAG